MAANQYEVYENYPNNKAVGHKTSCAHFKKNGGMALATGKWLGPFNSTNEAKQAGEDTWRPFHWCKFCGG